MSYLEETDFDAKDRGGYQPPEVAQPYTYEQLEPLILDAMDAGYRTLPRIKRRAGIDAGYDLTPAIIHLEVEKIIRREDNGTITAFFRYRQKPKRFWLTGDGKVEAEFDETWRPSPELQDVGAWDSESASKLFDDGDKEHRGVAAKTILASELEELAATLPNMDAVTKALGYAKSTALYTRFKKEPDLRDAYDRGRQRWAKEHGTATKDQETIAGRKAYFNDPSKLDITLTETQVEEAARFHGKIVAMATNLDLSESTLYQQLQSSPRLSAAYKRGRAMFDEAERLRGAATHREKVITSAETTESERITQEETMSTATATAPSTLDVKKQKAYRLETISEAEMETIAAEELNIQDVAQRAAGVGQPAFSRMLNRRPAIRRAYERGIAKRQPTDGPKRGGRGFPITFTAEQCAEAAAKYGTLIGTATALGYASPEPFRQKLKKNLGLKAAFERGKARFTGDMPSPSTALPVPREETIEATAPTEPETPEAPVAADHVEAVAANEPDKITNTCSTCQNVIRDEDEMLTSSSAIGETEIRTYYFDTVECQNEKLAELETLREIALAEPLPDPPLLISEISDTAAEELIEEVTEYFNEVIAEGLIDDPLPPFDTRAAEFVPAFEGPAERFKVRPESTASIRFADGSKLSVTFDGNLFRVSPRDRAILSHIADLMRQYPDGLTITENTRPPKRPLWQRIGDVFNG